MPRYPRLFLPQMPLHIVQRGHDRQPIFLQRRDYEYYLSNVIEMKLELDIRVFAYCLMTNHVHLLVAPGEDVTAVSRFMRAVAARQTRYVNRTKNRTGTLWDGRFKASLVDSDSYFLACCRYIDLNPVRAALVAAPADYAWSSYRCHAAIERSRWLDEHLSLRELGRSQAEMARQYKAFVSRGTPDRELALIRQATCRNQLIGDAKFRKAISKRVDRMVSARGPGRPRSGSAAS